MMTVSLKMKCRSIGRSVNLSERLRQLKMLRRLKELLRRLLEQTNGKSPRVNYKQMSTVTYSALRQLDWYSTQPRAVHIEDHHFWCPEQLYIYQDIFAPMSKPIHPMHPIDLG
jgi:hypothetical protein